MKEPPCKDCEFRQTYCHAECSVYADWATTKREKRVYTNKERAALDAMWAYNGKRKKK